MVLVDFWFGLVMGLVKVGFGFGWVEVELGLGWVEVRFRLHWVWYISISAIITQSNQYVGISPIRLNSQAS